MNNSLISLHCLHGIERLIITNNMISLQLRETIVTTCNIFELAGGVHYNYLQIYTNIYTTKYHNKCYIITKITIRNHQNIPLPPLILIPLPTPTLPLLPPASPIPRILAPPVGLVAPVRASLGGHQGSLCINQR